MPKNTFERVVNTIIGVFFMVFVMSVRNKASALGSLSFAVFDGYWGNFLRNAPFAFVLQFFLAQKFAAKQAAKYPTDNTILYRLIRTGFTVLVMCPLFSLYNSIIFAVQFHWGFEQLICNVFTKMFENWLYAFTVQMFFVGPAQRWIFGLIFNRRAGAKVG